jgi:hypothetical protein
LKDSNTAIVSSDINDKAPWDRKSNSNAHIARVSRIPNMEDLTCVKTGCNIILICKTNPTLTLHDIGVQKKKRQKTRSDTVDPIQSIVRRLMRSLEFSIQS